MELNEAVQKKIEYLRHLPTCPPEVWEVLNALLAMLQQQTEEIARLQGEITRLTDQRHLDSHNSSKPPSSDSGHK
jgi:coenzyme F420-reducing hydrogenase gamma subunit